MRKNIHIPNALALLTGYRDGRANDKSGAGRRLTCPHCSQKFGNEGALKVHCQMRHPSKVLFYQKPFEKSGPDSDKFSARDESFSIAKAIKRPSLERASSRSVPEPVKFPVREEKSHISEKQNPSSPHQYYKSHCMEEVGLEPEKQETVERKNRARGVKTYKEKQKVKITAKTFRYGFYNWLTNSWHVKKMSKINI